MYVDQGGWTTEVTFAGLELARVSSESNNRGAKGRCLQVVLLSNYVVTIASFCLYDDINCTTVPLKVDIREL